MYPRLSDIFQDLFGFSLPIPIYSFGFMVAVAVMMAAWLLQKELDRKFRAGIMGSVRVPDPEASAKGKAGRGSRMVDASPSVLVGSITMLAVFSGFAGAKLFHILENLDQFARAPLDMIFSTGGFTFYGGFVVAMLVVSRYLKGKGVSVGAVSDAVAPGLMLAYGIGRIGCHLAGDGDWGIAANLAAKPDWLPMWLWAETYPNNILGIDLSAAPVYPTPIYEFVAALALFGVLWSLRRHAHRAGWLFWMYVVFAGVERFFIEKIRVNNEFDLLGFAVTQAEIISVLLVVAGLVGMWVFRTPGAAAVDATSRAET
ncbi:MAG: prolipoprotein diacylglyceryl transferase [Rhodothermales bacterium]